MNQEMTVQYKPNAALFIRHRQNIHLTKNICLH